MYLEIWPHCLGSFLLISMDVLAWLSKKLIKFAATFATPIAATEAGANPCKK